MILAFLLGIPFAWWIAILIALFIIDVACFAYENYGWSVTIMVASIIGAIWVDQHSAAPWVTANLHSIFLWYIPCYLGIGLGTALVKWVLYAAKRVNWIEEAKTEFDQKPFEPKKPDFRAKAFEVASAEYREKNFPSTSYLHPTNDTAEKEKATMTDRIEELVAKSEADWTASLPAQRREAFVRFYASRTAYRNHKIYDVDYTKNAAVVDALTPRAKDNVGKISIWIFQWPVVVVTSLIEDFIIKLANHVGKILDMMFSRVVRRMVAKATQGL